MPKHTLTETYIHSGELYGPGEVDLPENVAKDLAERGAFAHQTPDPPDPPAKPAAARR